MMGWSVLAQLDLGHGYYAPSPPPISVRPADPRAFARAGLLLRQRAATVRILGEEGARDLPDTVLLDLEAGNGDLISVTEGGDWKRVPRITLPDADGDFSADLGVSAPVVQTPGRLRLAQVVVPLAPGSQRRISLGFAAVSSHWAYHVIGPGSDDVRIDDPEGEVAFDAIGYTDLPDGTPARVIRSRAALPARARPTQRFTLSRPGPFGPRTLIPILPAPQPHFAQVPGPDGATPIVQSDVYVTIF